MTRDQLITQVQQYFDQGGFRADLTRRVAWRTESDLGPSAGPETRHALYGYLEAEIAPWLSQLGFVCEVHDNPQPCPPC